VRSTAALFASTWLLLAIAGRSRLLQDPGTLWHTLVGDEILARGFPRADWLSFTFAGHPWIAHQWIGECLMSVLHTVGGLDALLLTSAGALALVFAFLHARLMAASVSAVWSVLVVALVGAASSLHFHVRPHLLSLFAFTWLFARLADVDADRKPLVALWPLPLVFLVWVNSHGAVVGGFATLGLFVAGWFATWLTGGSSPVRGWRDAVGVAALVVACIATIPVTPYGLDTARTWFAILSSPLLPLAIVEHASLARTGSWQVLGIAALYVAALVGAPRYALRASAVVPLVWLILAFDRVRHAPFFALAAGIALADLLPAARWAGALFRRGFQVRAAAVHAPLLRLGAVAGIAMAAALASVAIVVRVVPERTPVVARLDPTHWPTELVPALQALQRELPDGAPILNDMLLGAFVAYEAPRLRVFVDDRWELYGDEFMLGYIRGEREWLDGWVERAGITVAFAENHSGLQRYLERDGRWKLVASSQAASLYRRVHVQTRASGPRTPAPTPAIRPGMPTTPD
jgi:hypothetical protein